LKDVIVLPMELESSSSRTIPCWARRSFMRRMACVS
jgi:hypothetical protein